MLSCLSSLVIQSFSYSRLFVVAQTLCLMSFRGVAYEILWPTMPLPGTDHPFLEGWRRPQHRFGP